MDARRSAAIPEAAAAGATGGDEGPRPPAKRARRSLSLNRRPLATLAGGEAAAAGASSRRPSRRPTVKKEGARGAAAGSPDDDFEAQLAAALEASKAQGRLERVKRRGDEALVPADSGAATDRQLKRLAFSAPGRSVSYLQPPRAEPAAAAAAAAVLEQAAAASPRLALGGLPSMLQVSAAVAHGQRMSLSPQAPQELQLAVEDRARVEDRATAAQGDARPVEPPPRVATVPETVDLTACSDEPDDDDGEEQEQEQEEQHEHEHDEADDEQPTHSQPQHPREAGRERGQNTLDSYLPDHEARARKLEAAAAFAYPADESSSEERQNGDDGEDEEDDEEFATWSQSLSQHSDEPDDGSDSGSESEMVDAASMVPRARALVPMESSSDDDEDDFAPVVRAAQQPSRHERSPTLSLASSSDGDDDFQAELNVSGEPSRSAGSAAAKAATRAPRVPSRGEKWDIDAVVEKPAFKDIHAALDSITIPGNTTRHNVKTSEDQEVTGMCLGVINGRSHGIVASSFGRNRPNLTKTLCNFARLAVPDFNFTSIQVNKNYLSAMHVDKNNLGPSYIVDVGDYKDGGLWVQRLGGVDCKNKWIQFDGNMPHCTLPYEGIRYTLIFFSQQSLSKLGAMRPNGDDINVCEELGFKMPPPGTAKLPYEPAAIRLKNGKAAFRKWEDSVKKGVEYDWEDDVEVLHKRSRSDSSSSPATAATAAGQAEETDSEEEDNDSDDLEIPPFLARRMRPHQTSGVKFMHRCVCGRRNPGQFGCVLADGMGLGKTLQAITLSYGLLKHGFTAPNKPMEPCRKIMIICPTSLIMNWYNEFTKWCGNRLFVLVVSGDGKLGAKKKIGKFRGDGKRPTAVLAPTPAAAAAGGGGGAARGTRTLPGWMREQNVMILSYETALRYAADLQGDDSSYCCDLIILDEAHRLKNEDSASRRTLSKLPCKRRVLLTGCRTSSRSGSQSSTLRTREFWARRGSS